LLSKLFHNSPRKAAQWVAFFYHILQQLKITWILDVAFGRASNCIKLRFTLRDSPCFDALASGYPLQSLMKAYEEM